MEKTIEVVVVASVAIIVMAIVSFLLMDEVGSFSGSTQTQLDSAECSQLRGQWETQKAFGSDSAAEEVKSEADSGGCDTSGWDNSDQSNVGPGANPSGPGGF